MITISYHHARALSAREGHRLTRDDGAKPALTTWCPHRGLLARLALSLFSKQQQCRTALNQFQTHSSLWILALPLFLAVSNPAKKPVIKLSAGKMPRAISSVKTSLTGNE